MSLLNANSRLLLSMYYLSNDGAKILFERKKRMCDTKHRPVCSGSGVWHRTRLTKQGGTGLSHVRGVARCWRKIDWAQREADTPWPKLKYPARNIYPFDCVNPELAQVLGRRLSDEPRQRLSTSAVRIERSLAGYLTCITLGVEPLVNWSGPLNLRTQSPT
jgi:hypothetical protein